MYKKLIIAFEGIEGSGKSLHIRNVSNYLKRKKISFIKIREPGGSQNSEKIRKLILNNKSNFNNKTDLLLYLAARSENFDKIISKNYRKKIILIDRFTDSTIAYQHYGMKISKKIIKILNSFILKSIKVDYTFLHTVNITNLKKRLNKRKKLNRYDNFNYSFYKNVQKGYLKEFKLNKKRYLIINSNNKINDNKIIVLNRVKKLLNI